MATKMKGLLKGLRYISQIFDDDEKEPEMQIGFPTDVKHVGHIGCDGPVNNSPSWLENFKLDKDTMSGPLRTDDSILKSSIHGSSPARDFPDLPKPSRRYSANGDIFSMDSPNREKSDKTTSRHSRKSHSGSEVSDIGSSISSSRNQLLPDLVSGSESPSRNVPDIPKKIRRKKSKDSSQGGSSKFSSRTAKAIAEASGYSSILRNTDLYTSPSRNLQPFNDTTDKKLNGFS